MTTTIVRTGKRAALLLAALVVTLGLSLVVASGLNMTQTAYAGQTYTASVSGNIATSLGVVPTSEDTVIVNEGVVLSVDPTETLDVAVLDLGLTGELSVKAGGIFKVGLGPNTHYYYVGPAGSGGNHPNGSTIELVSGEINIKGNIAGTPGTNGTSAERTVSIEGVANICDEFKLWPGDVGTLGGDGSTITIKSNPGEAVTVSAGAKMIIDDDSTVIIEDGGTLDADVLDLGVSGTLKVEAGGSYKAGPDPVYYYIGTEGSGATIELTDGEIIIVGKVHGADALDPTNFSASPTTRVLTIDGDVNIVDQFHLWSGDIATLNGTATVKESLTPGYGVTINTGAKLIVNDTSTLTIDDGGILDADVLDLGVSGTLKVEAGGSYKAGPAPVYYYIGTEGSGATIELTDGEIIIVGNIHGADALDPTNFSASPTTRVLTINGDVNIVDQFSLWPGDIATLNGTATVKDSLTPGYGVTINTGATLIVNDTSTLTIDDDGIVDVKAADGLFQKVSGTLVVNAGGKLSIAPDAWIGDDSTYVVQLDSGTFTIVGSPNGAGGIGAGRDITLDGEATINGELTMFGDDKVTLAANAAATIGNGGKARFVDTTGTQNNYGQLVVSDTATLTVANGGK
ncbi:MAG: hypothetical protein LBR39_00105, partial [Coriobacteriales bacterium]|nr:hypothetical protein [Coriobacteriales bacterium]